ncbi:MAG: V-type ATP synthase subunit E [Saccharofermentanales bacterium]
MDGLDAIRDKILAEANKNAQLINDETAKEIDLISADTKTKTGAIVEKAVEQAEKEAINYKKRIDSLSALETRKIILAAKQDIIDDVINQAISSLKNMPNDEKIKLYAGILMKSASGGEIIQLNKADSAFADEIKRTLPFPVEINPENGNFAGGLIIVRDTVEINMTFEMIAKQYRSELVAIAADSLFTRNQV